MDAPEKVCLLRLSAIGDTCHVVPLLRTLQDAWPRTRFTWVIGKLEAKLMSLIPDVELITVDKGAGLSAFSRLRTEMLRRGAFDLLLHLQLSIRASAAAACIRAPIKLGFDKERARELQWLFTNRRIAPRTREHVLDSFSGFADALGIAREPPRWAIPLPPRRPRIRSATDTRPSAHAGDQRVLQSSRTQLAAGTLCRGGRARGAKTRHAGDLVRWAGRH